MQGNHFKRPSTLGRMVATALLVVTAGVAGAVGAAHAQMRLDYTNIGGGMTGDGGMASAANIVGVQDMAYDSAGNLYITQLHGNSIRKITPAGVISTVVGGENGFGGDGGPASKALINRPMGVAIDANNNLYFVDLLNRRVRRITPSGTITTVAGNGQAVVAGDGGPATAASFESAWDLAIDKSGNLFVSETSSRRVRKITPAGIITTYAGTGEQGYEGDNGPATAARLSVPYGIDVDVAGNLYIADSGNRNVRRVSTTGTITTFAASLTFPYNVRVDKLGNVYVGDDCRILKFNSTGSTMLAAWGDYALQCQRSPDGTFATGAGFGFVNGIVIDAADNVLFADVSYERIAKIAKADGNLWTYAGVPTQFSDGMSAAAAPLMVMTGIAVADNGSVLVTDISASQVRSIAGGKVSTIAGSGRSLSECTNACSSPFAWGFGYVSGVATAPGGVTYVADRNFGVLRIDANQATQLVVSQSSVRSIATDLAGNMYFTDYERISKLDTAGNRSTVAGTGAYDPFNDGGLATSAGVWRPTQVAVDGGGAVYLYDDSYSIRKVGRDGKIRRIAGNGESGGFTGEGGLALNARLGTVAGIAVHPTGVYFLSSGKLRRIRPDARIETVAFPYYASGIAVKYGNLYITTHNGRVLRATLPRAVATADYNGDGKSDVLFRGTAGANLIWLGANNATRQAIATMATENKLAGQGDFDGDGETDLVWRNTLTGANIVWRSGNVNTQMILASVADQDWTIAGVGDFNGDGRDDLFWRHKGTGANEYWPGAAAGSKKAVTAQVDFNWTVAGIGDFDGDGRSDLFWRNTLTGANQVWPGLLASQVLSVSTVANLNWKVAAIGDFNGDGASDVVWRDKTNGASAIWRSANSAWRQSIVATTNMQWSIAAAADYDNDGIDDLLWRNNVSGENVIWKNANNATQKAVGSAGSSWKVQPFEAQP
jgi:sugar lactone lactonase YvrE